MDDLRIELPELGLIGETGLSAARELPLAARVTRRGEAAPAFQSKVLLGGPDLARMKPRDDEDPDVADRRDGNDFWTVLMSLSVEPEDPEILTGAWLRVDLAGEGSGPAPIAFAMRPSREEAQEHIEQSGTAEATIKVLKLGGGKTRSFTAQHAEVLAFNRLRSDPAWELAPSAGRPMRGPTDFILVIKAPQGSSGRGNVSFGATVEWREGILRRRHEVSWEGQEVGFTFSGQL